MKEIKLNKKCFAKKNVKLNETFAMTAIGNCHSNSLGTFHFSEIPIEIEPIKWEDKNPNILFRIIFFRLKINLMFAQMEYMNPINIINAMT